MKIEELIAMEFHAAYERLASDYSYVTWSDVPEPNRVLMVTVAKELLESNVISRGPKYGGASN